MIADCELRIDLAERLRVKWDDDLKRATRREKTRWLAEQSAIRNPKSAMGERELDGTMD
jgi:hypothetical protein